MSYSVTKACNKKVEANLFEPKYDTRLKCWYPMLIAICNIFWIV